MIDIGHVCDAPMTLIAHLEVARSIQWLPWECTDLLDYEATAVWAIVIEAVY